MRKRKYLKLRDGTLAPRDAFEAQLYQFMPMAPATDADEKDPARALASDPAAFRALYQMERAPAAHPEATIAPAPSPRERLRERVASHLDALLKEVNLDEVTMSSLRKRVAQDLRVEIRGDDKDWRGPAPDTPSTCV